MSDSTASIHSLTSALIERPPAFAADGTAPEGSPEAGAADRIEKLCHKYGLPVSDECTPSQMAEAARGDKKTAGSEINLDLLSRIGESFIKKIPLDELEAFISE